MSQRRQILHVDDDAGVRAVVRALCRREGYEVIEAATGAQGLNVASAHEPDLVLLDWVLPDLSGIDVCRELRRKGARYPILMLTGRTSKVDVVVGLEVGADDYITKPFDARELTARLRAHFRREERLAQPVSEQCLHAGAVEVDLEGWRVCVGGVEVRLTPLEFRVLVVLATNRGCVISRNQLLATIWGDRPTINYHSLDRHVQNLRRKLEAAGRPGIAIEPIAGVGYRLSPT